MSIKLQLPKLTNLRPRITVVGVGGAGSNAVNNMIASGLSGVNFVVANTDAQSLANSAAENRIQLGATLTEGLGAGAKPEIGRGAAEEAAEDIRAQVAGSHMVFVAAGMGGGTGTGATAVIARIARECGALTVGVVTKPFHFEGTRRMRAAEAGIAMLKPEVDTLIVIPNQNLFRIANERTTFAEAFVLADQVLYSGIACVVDLIVKEGLINLDFADVRTIMSGMGTAMMGTGEASGDRRAVMAAEEAISNPLLDDISLRGAKGLLVSITGSRDLKLYEVDEAATRVRQEVDGEANIIVGATFDDTLGDRIRVSIVASGMERLGEIAAVPPPAPEPAAPTPMSPPDIQPPFIEPYPDPYNQPALAAPLRAEAAPSMTVATVAPDPTQHVPSAPPGGQPPTAQAMPYWQQPPPDFARVLSEALDARHDVHPAHAQMPPQAANPPAFQQPYGQPPLNPQHYQQPQSMAAPAHPGRSAGSWASQSGAVFEEAPPHVAPATDVLSTLTQPPSAAPAHAASQDASFYPQAPVVPRGPPRRLPEVGDFPPVGQRDYHAKTGQYGLQPQAHPSTTPHRPPQPPAAEPPRKAGFFARLMGARRKSVAEARTTGDYPQAPSGPAGAHDHDVQGARDPVGASGRTASRGKSEKPDLPVFFGASRK